VTADPYAGAAARWARGASLLYAPAVAYLVRRFPGPLAGHLVLDAGAGTGIATGPLVERSARPVAADRSVDMLSWQDGRRPPAVAADVRALPFPDDTFDDALAAFVLNHLTEPAAGFAELARVTRPGGALVAAAFSTAYRSELRDRVDEVAARLGWRTPEWYLRLQADAVPRLGSAALMAEAAAGAGLADVAAEEVPVDVGIDRAEQLVDFRLGQAPFARWLDAIGPQRAEVVRREAVAAVFPDMRPYRPLVVVLTARAPTRRPAAQR
jgi:SAM-dependent methyltransferase